MIITFFVKSGPWNVLHDNVVFVQTLE